jgi:hypothetical protein
MNNVDDAMAGKSSWVAVGCHLTATVIGSIMMYPIIKGTEGWDIL